MTEDCYTGWLMMAHQYGLEPTVAEMERVGANPAPVIEHYGNTSPDSTGDNR